MTEPFLSNLGISERDQLLGPTKQNMPTKFNSACAKAIDIWNTQVENSDGLGLSGIDAWGYCVQNYVLDCVAASIFPYLTDPGAVNASIFSKLQSQRRQVVDCLCLSKDLNKVIESSVSKVTRTVDFINSGFTITCTARLRLDFFEASKIAESLGFTSSLEGYYKKDLGNGVCIALQSELDRPDYTNLCYQICQDTLPYLASNYTPSRAELSKFILDIMYIPIIKMSSPTIFAQRLF